MIAMRGDCDYLSGDRTRKHGTSRRRRALTIGSRVVGFRSTFVGWAALLNIQLHGRMGAESELRALTNTDDHTGLNIRLDMSGFLMPNDATRSTLVALFHCCSSTLIDSEPTTILLDIRLATMQRKKSA